MFLTENLSFHEMRVYSRCISQKKEVKSVREELFKMERKGLVQEGQQVKVTERVNGSLYSYLVEPSVAMSGIYRSNQRIKSKTGIINEIRETQRGFYLVVGFEE